MSHQSALTGVARARKGVGAAGGGQRIPADGRRRTGGRALTLALFAAPSAALLALLTLYPLAYGLFQSVSNGTLISSGSFVGLQNYVRNLSSENFWHAALFTVIFTVSGVFGSWLIGLGLALLLRTRPPGAAIWKTLLLLPWTVPVVVSATSWNWLVATPQSPLPQLAAALGFGNVLFLANPVLAQVTVCVFKIWVSFPFMMMMMSSALSSVDTQLYEAAKLDGATAWQTFRRITLPLISQSTFISWILMTIFCVNDFPTIFLLTSGGPVYATTSLVVLAYRTVFQSFNTGLGVAAAFLMTFVLIVVSVALYRWVRRVPSE
jgi:multiple sugar transport system permease protein